MTGASGYNTCGNRPPLSASLTHNLDMYFSTCLCMGHENLLSRVQTLIEGLCERLRAGRPGYGIAVPFIM